MKLQWLKIETDIFDNAKIRRIRRMPGGNELFVLWVGLLTLGMKCQISGRLEISDGLPYNEDDLASEFDIQIDTVKLGLKVFEELKMITILDGNTIEISNFRRYQNIERIDQVRELARIRQAKRREQLLLTHKTKIKDLEGDKDKEEEVSKTKSVSHAKVTRDNISPEAGGYTEIIALFTEKYFMATTAKPIWNGRTGKELKRLLVTYSKDELIAAVSEWFKDDWARDNSLEFSTFCSMAGKMVAKSKGMYKRRPAGSIDAADKDKFEDMKRRMAANK